MAWKSTMKVSSVWPSSAVHENVTGIGWFLAVLFIVADMMGAGMVALPYAIKKAGLLPGAILLIAGALCSGFTGVQLSDNWVLMQIRWPEYRKHTRRPYPEMAKRALGRAAEIIMEICMAITLFGVVTTLIVLSSRNLSTLLKGFSLNLNLCIMIVIVTLAVWPFTLLKSPMHFWQAGVVSAAASALAAVLIVLGIGMNAPTCMSKAPPVEFEWTNLFLAYGTMVFAYGGHSAFPTIQHDMRKPLSFSKSVIVSYIFILVVYLLVACLGVLVYGGDLKETIIESIQTKWISDTVNILITLHVLPAIIIVFSPLCQLVEEWTKTPQEFGTRRVISRSTLLFLCMFAGESCPNLSALLDLVGGSTTSLMTMIMPSVFWLYLTTSKKLHDEQIAIGRRSPNAIDDTKASLRDVLRLTPKSVLAVNGLSMLFGAVGAIAATGASIYSLFYNNVSPPCYVSWINGSLE